MQNNDVRGKSGGFQLAKYRWLVILSVVVLAVVVYLTCKPAVPRPSTKDLFYEPLGGAWVNDSLGNGDGELNPGEQVKVFARLTNSRRQRIPAFDLVLSTPEKGVDVKDNKCHYPAIEPGQTVRSEDPFEFFLDSLFVSESVLFFGRIENMAQAGFVGDAFAANGDDEIPIILAATTNYRLCLVSCLLEEQPEVSGSTNRNYILTIDLRLCNTSSELDKPSLRIDPASIKVCDLPNSFAVRQEQNDQGIMTAFDHLFYTSNLNNGECKKPDSPILQDETVRFKFIAAMEPLGSTITDKCVYFSVEVNRHTIEISEETEGSVEISTLVARVFIAGEAQVIPSESLGIASLHNRPKR